MIELCPYCFPHQRQMTLIDTPDQCNFACPYCGSASPTSSNPDDATRQYHNSGVPNLIAFKLRPQPSPITKTRPEIL